MISALSIQVRAWSMSPVVKGNLLQAQAESRAAEKGSEGGTKHPDNYYHLL
jgi:hypothetical protein